MISAIKKWRNTLSVQKIGCVIKSLKDKILECSEKGIFTSIAYLIITVVAIMFPIIYRAIGALLCLDPAKIDIWSEFESGNFFLYALSLITPILFVVKCLLERQTVVVTAKLPFLESLAAIFISVLCYVVVQNNYENINATVLVILSLIVFCWAIILAYKIHRFEAVNNKTPYEISRDNINKITEEVVSLNDQETSANKRGKGKTKGKLDESFDEMGEIE